MNNKFIVAAAGSGKTEHLVEEALKIKDGRVLITTYTNANEREIRERIYLKNKCIPSNIDIQTWFSFLLQHGVRPYQNLLFPDESRIRGLVYSDAEHQESGRRFKANDKQYYLTKAGYIYPKRVAGFTVKVNDVSGGLVVKRLAKIYTHIFVDEVQDMSGYGLDFIRELLLSPINTLMVGDPRQCVYSTHHEQKNRQYTGKVERYFSEQCDKLVEIDNLSLKRSFRCNQSICDFANSLYPELSACESACCSLDGHSGIYLVAREHLNEYMDHLNAMQLRYNSREQTLPEYQSMNMGESKGMAFDHVVIYPTKAMLGWLQNKSELKPESKAKLYVAITRARHSVGIVCDACPVLPTGVQWYRNNHSSPNSLFEFCGIQV